MVVAMENSAPYRNIVGIYLALINVTFLSYGWKMHPTKNQVFLVVAFLCAIVCSYVQCGKSET